MIFSLVYLFSILVKLAPSKVAPSNDDKYGFLGGFGDRKVVDIDEDIKISLSSEESDSDEDTARFYSRYSQLYLNMNKV